MLTTPAAPTPCVSPIYCSHSATSSIVTTVTHTAGHTLDLVIARTDTDISDVDFGGFISDHALVRFTIRVRRPIDAPQPVSCRAWKRYEKDVFACDLAASQLCSNIEQLCDKSADDLAVLYRDVMTQLLDKHCPVVTVCRRPRPAMPWSTLSAATLVVKPEEPRDALGANELMRTSKFGRTS